MNVGSVLDVAPFLEESSPLFGRRSVTRRLVDEIRSSTREIEVESQTSKFSSQPRLLCNTS